MLAREVSGLGPTAWGKRLGITASAVWNIETGRAYPAMRVIVAACDEFGYSADWFLRGVRAGLPERLASALKAAEAARRP